VKEINKRENFKRTGRKIQWSIFMSLDLAKVS
jgi:hypothetical protein